MNASQRTSSQYQPRWPRLQLQQRRRREDERLMAADAIYCPNARTSSRVQASTARVLH